MGSSIGKSKMIKGWDDAPVVDLPIGIDPKHVTFIYPYYCNAKFLERQIDGWLNYPSSLRKYLSAVVVDDGSPEGCKAEDVLRNAKHRPFFIRLFNIDVDIRFNWIAARNIAMLYAVHGWCLGTDMDHIIPQQTAEALVWRKHDLNVIYRLRRFEHTGEEIHPHPNSWFMTKQTFWKFGGYDESFSGYCGTDGEARRRWIRTASIKTLPEHLVRYEYVDDSSTVRYKRKQPEDAAVQRILKERKKGWKPKIFTFPFHEVVV
jgi:hypothetical protein